MVDGFIIIEMKLSNILQINRAGDVNMWRCSDGVVMMTFESGQELTY